MAASRPIWSGVLSFGLLNIPVSLMSGERKNDLSFRMLDCRNNAPVRYERVNSETGEEVPWSEICKAYEYEKGNFVVLEKGDIEGAAAEGKEAVAIEAFVDLADINPMYFEKPYVLVPGKKADKGYVLLRDTLADTGKVGIARVVVRTREYLCAVLPQGDALVVLLMRYSNEVAELDEFKLPEGRAADYKLSAAELSMARQLIESMSVQWDPTAYHDEFRERVQAMIDERIRSSGVVGRPTVSEAALPENAATNVVDFMALLQKSLASKTGAASKPANGASGKRSTASGNGAAGGDKPAPKRSAGKSAGKRSPGSSGGAAKKAPAGKRSQRKAG
jgi:DNA end-binding protein Ku